MFDMSLYDESMSAGSSSAQAESHNIFMRGLAKFIRQSPTSFHAAYTGATYLEAAGFHRVDPAQPWPNTPGCYYLMRDGALIAWDVPANATRFSIIGCHTDSPAFQLKPTPQATTADGWGRLNFEVYGGMLPNSWLDRDLGLAGRLVTLEGEETLVSTGPLVRIPQLAIHLDRSAREQLHLDLEDHLQGVWTVDDPDADIMEVLAHEAGWESHDIAGWDIFTYDTQGPARLGADRQFFVSGRQDNLLSVYAGLWALIDSATGKADAVITDPRENKVKATENTSNCVRVLAAFNHEEVGSGSAVGAAGPLLEQVLERISGAIKAGNEHYRRMLAASTCLSSDVAHSVHPNYADRHDPHTRPVMGRGPVLKINANQRYSTDAVGHALWKRALRDAGVKSQAFVSKNSIPCGSTIAPLTATRLGITTVDVGAPILSMHSAREMCHSDDQVSMSRTMRSYYML